MRDCADPGWTSAKAERRLRRTERSPHLALGAVRRLILAENGAARTRI
jgi:hypothetical protein